MNQNRLKLAGWQKYDANGFMIPGTAQYRPLGVVPKDGKWIQIPSSICCDCACIITFIVQTTNTEITSVASSDGRINWEGSVDGYKSFVIPNCYDMEFTVTISAPGADIAINASTVQGEGTIDEDPSVISSSATPETFTITTSATRCSEYTVILSDD